LLRVRDEIRMTIAAYQTLYESSVAFGMRKALLAEQGKADMEKKVRESLAFFQIQTPKNLGLVRLAYYYHTQLRMFFFAPK